ncbi:MAG: hypothetical protein IPK44_01015 [Candidatus Accumulibacter sp.]|jgi:hypothetical protein|uniref:hypothetical protein n=1 Tax=Accumulibacter sp. TaxID=2053492 RepID=UPI002584CA9D|nr:hypothetical protein [Accumulibacter sp.]MBK8113178.1 hypothetical protein [Accumulibacter sp.]
MDQTLINYLMAGFGAAISFILRVIWEGLRELQKCDLEITSKINEIQLLVAGQYVKKEDLEKLSTALFNKLDRIELKVDGKMDREPK